MEIEIEEEVGGCWGGGCGWKNAWTTRGSAKRGEEEKEKRDEGKNERREEEKETGMVALGIGVS